MRLFHHLGAACLLAAVAIWITGCPTATNTTPKVGEEHGHEHGEHAHGEAGHAHDHSHAHGLHGGHIIEIGEEEYHAEWTHADDGTVTIYILDAAMKNEVPIPAENITIETKIGETAATFTLAAVNRTEGDMPKSAKFELVDKNLLGVLETLSKGVTATLKVTINDKLYDAPITHDEHKH
jgi:hypothetical protein